MPLLVRRSLITSCMKNTCLLFLLCVSKLQIILDINKIMRTQSSEGMGKWTS
jgi:hypothetical protein